jgi:hypothetical protein
VVVGGPSLALVPEDATGIAVVAEMKMRQGVVDRSVDLAEGQKAASN